MKRSTETSLVRACLDLLALRGVLAWRNNTTGVYDPSSQRFRTFSGRKGVSDILGVLPGGRFIAVECKAGENRLTPEQARFLEDVQKWGGVVVVAWGLDDLEEALQKALQGGDAVEKEDLELSHEMLLLVGRLLRSPGLVGVSVQRAIETAVPDSDLPEEDKQVVLEWLEDVRAGRI